MAFSSDDLETCLRVLQEVSDDPVVMNHHERFKSLIARIHKEGKKGERRADLQQARVHDAALKSASEVVRQQSRSRSDPLLPACDLPTDKTLRRPIDCYVCKRSFTRVHFFYHLLCPDCAASNYEKRNQRVDLSGRIALVTGGRIKIGYQTALRLLRDGAAVVVTTRFPHDCARRFSEEPDFASWQDRLHIYGLDLRNVAALEAFVLHVSAAFPALDIIINNAAQTIKRPSAFYEHLSEGERAPTALSHEARAALREFSANVPLLEHDKAQRGDSMERDQCFPPDVFDADGQPLDARPVTSWLLRLHEVSTVELLEVQLVNAIAPFMLNSKLKPLLLRSLNTPRFIVNVSAMEGQFQRESKTSAHPHTNMAKAALNMMTRTSASDYAADGIWMNSVDTGWITDENPFPKKTRIQERTGFYTPLDIIDGVSRIYDPIVQGIRHPNEPCHGHFLKDYAPHPW